MSTDDRARFEKLRRDLAAAIPKKRAIDKQLAAIESQIYHLEGLYITDTTGTSGGNLIHGFDNYLKGPPTGRKRADVHESDRLFSNSSSTYQKSVELEGEETESISAGRSQDLTPAQQNKLLRDKEYQRQKRAKNSAAGRNRQQSASIASDDESVSGTISSSRRPLKRKAADED